MRQIKVPGTSKPKGFSHVVALQGSVGTVYISGQGPTDSFWRTVGVGDFQAQVVQAFENLGRCLRAAGTSFDRLVKLAIYVVPMDKFEIVRKVRKRYLNQKRLPSITSVGVTSLVNKDWMIEIEAVAELKPS